MEKSEYNALLYGKDPQQYIVAVEYITEKKEENDKVVLFLKKPDNSVEKIIEYFSPFIAVAYEIEAQCPIEHTKIELNGPGVINTVMIFKNMEECIKARDWLKSVTGKNPTSPEAPYLWISDPVQQYLLWTGKTLFKGLNFDQIRRLQFDIECMISEGFEFCNPLREEDRIIAIGLCDNTGWEQVLMGNKLSEKEMLEEFVKIIQERDPDIIEGHNIFNFDLPYIATRAKIHGVELTLGRDGSPPSFRNSRITIAERNINYQRYDIFGRHIVDTLFLVHAYDVMHRDLDSFGLKQLAKHFGIDEEDRTYIAGEEISHEFKRCPEKVAKYVLDDVRETRSLSTLLSHSYFLQTVFLPYSYQNVCVRGNAAKIDALMIREYLRQRLAFPLPEEPRTFKGGYTDIFVTGVTFNVKHCDVRSLYPSLMISKKIAPKTDHGKVFIKLLEEFHKIRIEAKEKAKKSKSKEEQNHYNALQATMKVFINSFYGYLGFSQARFNDYDSAEKVTSEGRNLLRKIVERLRELKSTVIEIDTDGIYFVPAEEYQQEKEFEKLKAKLIEILPEGIELEFDASYKAMYSYKMKNYALLTHDGEIIIKGAALKSRGLEPFQRNFLAEMIKLKLTQQEDKIPELKHRYEMNIKNHVWDISMFAKKELLTDTIQTYFSKRAKGRPRSAAYELAAKSGKPYKPGDYVSYYVTGTKPNISVYNNAKLVSDWDPKKRDENINYYLAKLETLYRKFTSNAADLNLEEREIENEE